MQLFANLLVLVSALHLALASPEIIPAAGLVVRQTTTTTTTTQADPCRDYSMTANMSTIGTNITYRAAFLKKSPVGTIPNSRMLNAAMLKLPKLTADVQLNAQCGNLTTVAITEAANNFTKGIVAQFTTEGLPVGIRNGPVILFIVGIISILCSAVWVFAE